MNAPDDKTIAGRLIHQAKDIHQYNEMKDAREREIEATHKLFESLRRKLGSDAAAKAALKKRGYNVDLLN